MKKDFKVLIIEDDKDMAELIKDFIESEDMETFLAYDGRQAIECFKEAKPDLVILDIMLPYMDGIEICKIIRKESAIPVLIISAKNSDIDKVLALGIGADDYITKPFSPIELVARVKAHLRRYTQLSSVKKDNSYIKLGDISIELKEHIVKCGDKQIQLSNKEFVLLKYFMQNPFQVLTREQIYNNVWNYEDYGDINAVTVYIRKLREKIEINPDEPLNLKTVWGVGYKFEAGLRN